MNWEIFTTPAPLINMAARAFARIGERRLKRFGVGIAQVPVFHMLQEHTALSQKELADLARIEQPSMAQTLARMDRDGLIRRTPDPHDRRSSLVSLTEKALDLIPALDEALEQGRAEMLQGFRPEEIATLCGLLRRLNQNLDRMAGEQDTPA